MTIEALDDGVNVNIRITGTTYATTFQIQLNNGSWIDVSQEDIGSEEDYNLINAATVGNKNVMAAGDKIRFRNISLWAIADTLMSSLKVTGTRAKVYGKLIDSLSDYLATSTDLTYKLTRMFSGSTALTDASKLDLCGIDFTQGCYSYMFLGCTSLTAAPALPATMLAIECYKYMFANCTSLVNAPKLPATALALYCYYSMFYGCTNITELHYPASIETDSTFTSMSGRPKFGATNATAYFDL